MFKWYSKSTTHMNKYECVQRMETDANNCGKGISGRTLCTHIWPWVRPASRPLSIQDGTRLRVLILFSYPKILGHFQVSLRATLAFHWTKKISHSNVSNVIFVSSPQAKFEVFLGNLTEDNQSCAAEGAICVSVRKSHVNKSRGGSILKSQNQSSIMNSLQKNYPAARWKPKRGSNNIQEET